MAKKLKIVSISSEMAPFSKTGGLGDVARSLPKAIKRLGHEVICITPLYGKIIDKDKYDLKLLFKDVEIFLNSKESVKINCYKGYSMHDLPVYFIENKKYFSKQKNLYGSKHENARFLVFDVAALRILSLLKFDADIIHCHDWQTGMIPFYLKNKFRYSKTLSKAKVIFTLHNLIFQFGKNWWEVPPEKKDFGRKRIPHLADPEIEYVNFAKRGILSADAISTVSENHREEIMTRKYGQDLHRILKNRENRLFGIVNGISAKSFTPVKDPSLCKSYDYNKVENKKINKECLQEKFGLAKDPNVPLICTTSRITFQKGFDLINQILEPISKLDAQFIFLGSGDKNFIRPLKKIAKKNSDKIVVVPSHELNQQYEHLTFAGSDFFLLPSHFEPCGINQLKAMRYGCVPIVRKVGGLNDTVQDFDPEKGSGTGFAFSGYDKYALFSTIVRALETYKYKKVWHDIVVRCMKESNSWEIPAKKYVSLFETTLKEKKTPQEQNNKKKK
jgi:starch synthase